MDRMHDADKARVCEPIERINRTSQEAPLQNKLPMTARIIGRWQVGAAWGGSDGRALERG